MQITTINGETGEVIEREMTAEEAADHAATIADNQAALAELNGKNAQKQAALEKLGLTEEEAKLLLS